MDEYNAPATQLLTLLNISATKAGKRKRSENDFIPAVKLNKRKSIKFGDAESSEVMAVDIPLVATVEVDETVVIEETLDDAEAEGM